MIRLVLLACALFAVLLFVPPIPQWQSYHDFADTRTIFGIHNFFNICSSYLFCFVAIWGFVSLWQKRNAFSFVEIFPFLLFFVGLFLVGLGSGFYHLEPNDTRLVFDRMSMSIVFMAMLAIAISTKISPITGFYLVLPLLLFGLFSVYYWGVALDLRLYGFTQYASILFTIVILIIYKTPYPPISFFVWAFSWYALAKFFELSDRSIYEATNYIISGHTLKHLTSCVSASYFVRMVRYKEIKKQ